MSRSQGMNPDSGRQVDQDAMQEKLNEAVLVMNKSLQVIP